MPAINFDAIPHNLKTRRQWVNWRYETRDGKRTKVPHTPDGRRASVTDSKTWSIFAECVKAIQRFDGIGIVCANGLVGIDLDHCIDDHGNLSDLARHVVNVMQTYTEITPSGRGLRCLGWGKLPEGGRRKDALGIEMYDSARYFTVTGNHLPNTPAAIEPREAELAQLHQEIFGSNTRADGIAKTKPRLAPVGLDDKQLIEKAMRAKNGDAFARLWKGDTTEHNDNHSDADLALCSYLAFWTGGDATRIDWLFRQSGLMRPKWDERHSARGETYGQMTIAKALASAHEFYTPSINWDCGEPRDEVEKSIAITSSLPATPSEIEFANSHDRITWLTQQVDAIPADTDKVRLSQVIRPVLNELAKLDKATAITFLMRKVKEHFKLTRVELSAFESDLAKLRKEWTRAESDRKAKEAQGAREQAAQPKEMTHAERTEAIEFLKDPRIIERIICDTNALGYVGEEGNKVTLYLVATSRKQDNPLSAVIKSPSAYGKSELVNAIVTLMPPEEVREFTRLTAQAITYMSPDALKHKLMVVTERNGSEESDYTIRVMQSEKKIRVAFPTKDPDTGEMRTTEHEVNGPMAYVETTTRPTIHPENATRVFELYLDGSEQQTQRIHEAQRKNTTLEGLRQSKPREAIIRRHQNAQRLLTPVNVVIPYAEFINFPATNPRTRRDLPRFLEMIKVVAFLRQFQKERKQDFASDKDEKLEYIEADLTDYAVAYRYATPALASGLDELPKHSRALLNKIIVMVANKIMPNKIGEKQFTRRDIRRHCGVTDKFVKDYVTPLEDNEYLEIVSGGTSKGIKYVYKLPEAVLDAQEGTSGIKGLTTPKELAEMIRLAS